MKQNEKAELLDTDIDFRLTELWLQLDDVEEWTVEALAAFLRAAYGRGYIDALEEERAGHRAKLCKDNDYRIP